jgi:phosphate/sulfate permease
MTGWTVLSLILIFLIYLVFLDKLSYYSNVIKNKLYFMRESSGLKDLIKFSAKNNINNTNYSNNTNNSPRPATGKGARANNSNNSNNSNFNNNKEKIKQIFLNIISYALGIFFIYIIILLIKLSGINISPLTIISFSLSFVIFNFVFNKFKYSNNIFIRLIQKFIIYNVCFLIFITIAGYLYLNIFNTFYCDNSDDEDNNETSIVNNNNQKIDNKNDTNIVNNNKQEINNNNEYFEFKFPAKPIDYIAKGIGTAFAKGVSDYAAAAGGVAASAFFYFNKSSASLAPLPRIVGAAVAGGATAIGVIVGNRIGKSIGNKVNVLEEIKNHKNSDPDIERIPSPDDLIISSPFEDGNIPLVDLLLDLVSLNLIEIIIIISIILMIGSNKNNNIIYNLIKKYIPNNYLHLFIQKVSNFNTKFTNFMLIIMVVILLLIKLGNLYVSCELFANIEDYVIVYNYIKKNSLLMIISLNSIKLNNKTINNIKHNIFILKFKLLYGYKYLFYIINRAVKMLYTWGLLAWISKNIYQRLNVKHSSTTLCSHNSKPNHINFTRQNLKNNNELFYLWLVGFTDAKGTFLIAYKNENWSLFFKISQLEYNLRLLYFIKSQLGVGQVKRETKTNKAIYKIRDRNKLAEVIFPIFDKYTLLTSNHFNYLKFKDAYRILEDSSLSTAQQDELMYALIKKVPASVGGESYLSPAWKKVNNRVTNTNEVNMVMSKAWLIGFTEAKGNFYLVNISKYRFIHGFEITKTKNLDLIVLFSIRRILGIKPSNKINYHTVVTTNSRSIENIIKYYNNTMKGMITLSFKL